MTRRGRSLVALVQALLLLGLGIAVPLLDARAPSHVPVLESEHSASTCVFGHDHTVCTQVGSNPVLSTEHPRHGPAAARVLEMPIRSVRGRPASGLSLVHHSRAPPRA